jgi:hypothetical protein
MRKQKSQIYSGFLSASMIAVFVLIDENHQNWQDHTGNDSGNDHLFHK